MSDMVDIGIRQNGMENISPEAMPLKAHDVLRLFMLNDEKQAIDGAYHLVNYNNISEFLGDIDAEKKINKTNLLSEKYPLLKEENIYILKDSSYKDRDTLDKYFYNSVSRIIKYSKEKSSIKSYQGFYNEFLEHGELFSDSKLLEIDERPLYADIYQEAASLNKQMYLELKMDIISPQRRYILKTGLWMLLLTITSLIITLIQNYYSSRMSSGVAMNLRRDVFEKVESFSENEFNKISAASFLTRTINDVNQVKDSIIMGLQIFIPPIMLAGGTVMAVKKSLSMSWIIFLGAIVSSLVIITVFVLIFPKVKLMQKLLDRFNLIIKERLTGIMVIKTMGNINLEEEKFDKTNKELSGISAFVNKLIMYVSPILTITVNIVGTLILWLGSSQIVQSKMQIGDLMAFIQYSSMVIGAFLIMVMMFSSFSHAIISIDRVYEILEMEPSIKDAKDCIYLPKDFKVELCFKNVSFSYGNNENFALKDINLKVKKGEIISIIGSTGAGKSTLVSLIPRLYDVTSGEILIDGINIKNIKQSELRSKIAYIPQKSILFTGDIEYNLNYGINDVKSRQFANYKNSEWLSDIMSNGGLKKEVAQEGKNFSGGQRQRICIARALIRNTPIIIFDDSFSSLDFNTETLIRKEIGKNFHNSLIIFVSQRIGSALNSDKIIVLDKGKIVGQGKHNKLMKTCPIYREIAESQIQEGVLQ